MKWTTNQLVKKIDTFKLYWITTNLKNSFKSVELSLTRGRFLNLYCCLVDFIIVTRRIRTRTRTRTRTEQNKNFQWLRCTLRLLKLLTLQKAVRSGACRSILCNTKTLTQSNKELLLCNSNTNSKREKMTTNMELASQVGKGDGAASAGEVWVSRRPESAVVLAKDFLFFFRPFLPIFRTKMENVLWPISATFFKKF